MTGFLVEIALSVLFIGALVGFFAGCAFQKHMDDDKRSKTIF